MGVEKEKGREGTLQFLGAGGKEENAVIYFVGTGQASETFSPFPPPGEPDGTGQTAPSLPARTKGELF